MKMNAQDYQKKELVEKIAYINIADVNNTLLMLNNLLLIRKQYAIMYLDSQDMEPRHLESEQGIDFCNSKIKKLLGII